MQEFLLLKNSEWKKVVQIQLTPDQIRMLFSTSPETRQEIKSMLDSVEAQRKLPVSISKGEELDSLHESLKPVLVEGNTYELVYLSTFERTTGSFTSCLKYSLNGITKHKNF